MQITCEPRRLLQIRPTRKHWLCSLNPPVPHHQTNGHHRVIEVNFSKLTNNNRIFRNDFNCIHYHLCKIYQIIECTIFAPYELSITNYSMGSSRSFHIDTEKDTKVLRYCGDVLQRGGVSECRRAAKGPRVTSSCTFG